MLVLLLLVSKIEKVLVVIRLYEYQLALHHDVELKYLAYTLVCFTVIKSTSDEHFYSWQDKLLKFNN